MSKQVESPLQALPLLLVFLAGFGMKAGLFPMHVWLPEAHPAAPSHVSALMSGVMIKTGVYGILRVTAREDEVLLLENEKPAVTVRTESRGTALRQSAVSSELDIRGMAVDEALPVLDNFLDAAYMGNLPNARIIHGKGTGVLRAAVQEELRRCKYVKSFRLGVYGEGESGVTIVEFK